jgi:signal transduction histidine kinase
MIDRLVNHAGSGQRTKAAAAESTVLPPIAERCKGLLSRVAGREVEIECSIGAFEPVQVPAEAVERILTNLVKNAAEATPWVGAITIRIEGSEELSDDGSIRRRVMLTVRDRGCGMDAAAIRGLMQGAGIPSKKGRGLGFRVVRELVALSGGCLSIESQPEAGTSVSAEWYAVKRPEEREQPVTLSAPRTRQEIRTLRKEEAEWIAC